MKKLTIFLLSLVLMQFSPSRTGDVFTTNSTASNTELRSLENNAFQAGEKLKYVLHYGAVNAGVAELRVDKSDKKVKNRELLHVVGTGRTISAFDWVFKVRDRYETYLDKQGVFPWVFVRRVQEGSYETSQNYTFFQHQEKVKTKKGKTHDVPENIQDMLSSLYYARTLDFSKAKKGDVFAIQTFVDGEVFPVAVRFNGREEKKTKAGTFNCIILNPIIQEGRVFKNEEDMTVWVTNDDNHVPVLAQAEVLVGSIKMELISYEGLVHPISKVK